MAMKRRTVLAVGGATALGAFAGCLVSESEMTSIDTIYEWHENGEANFVDARSREQYDAAHIAGAVFSPADDGLSENDPVAEWSEDTRIVTYCDCPHSLAQRRAESLAGDGYDNVHVLDEGFEEWMERGYPVQGTQADQALPAYEVSGVSDPDHAGEDVWIRDPVYGQREVGPVGDDGSYELTLHFYDLSPDSPLEVDAPDYTFESTLAELTDTEVSPDMA